ncbi:MAG TPA: pilus assembly protein PilM, partial [Desulfobacteria bacterium]|nr:pilus assembly protein PilM [Desulfobacteria bacterium]
MALFASDTVALDIGSYAIKGAVVNPRSGLKKYAAVPTPQGAAIGGTINNPEELVAALKQLWQMLGAKGSDVISAVPSQYVFVRNFTLPMMKKSELEQAVKFQTEGQIPLPPAELVLDFAVLSEDKKAKQMEVMVAATRRSVIQQMVQILAQAELNAKVFDLESLALSRVFLNTERKQAGDGWDMFISTGANTTHISIFERNRLLFTRSIPFGGFRFTRALSMEQSISV